jgi:cytochrome c
MARLALFFFCLSIVLRAAAQQPAAFERCVACHGNNAGDLGPSLAGVFGRKAGAVPNFRYSRALMRSAVVWDERSLDAFLTAPDQFVPGTRMPFEGLPSAADRAAVIKHLRTLK